MNLEIEKLKIEREELDKKIDQLESDLDNCKIKYSELVYVQHQIECMIRNSHLLSIRIRIKSERIENPLITF